MRPTPLPLRLLPLLLAACDKSTPSPSPSLSVERANVIELVTSDARVLSVALGDAPLERQADTAVADSAPPGWNQDGALVTVRTGVRPIAGATAVTVTLEAAPCLGCEAQLVAGLRPPW